MNDQLCGAAANAVATSGTAISHMRAASTTSTIISAEIGRRYARSSIRLMPSQRLPQEVSALLHELKTRLPVILGRNLVRIYLYGSLTQRTFDPKCSDVDCIVVTRRDLTRGQFDELGAWLALSRKTNSSVLRLQILFLIQNQLLTMDAKACLYQFGVLKRSGTDGNPIIWLNVLQRGIVLHGPQPESFVPTIDPDLLLNALHRGG